MRYALKQLLHYALKYSWCRRNAEGLSIILVNFLMRVDCCESASTTNNCKQVLDLRNWVIIQL